MKLVVGECRSSTVTHNCQAKSNNFEKLRWNLSSRPEKIHLSICRVSSWYCSNWYLSWKALDITSIHNHQNLIYILSRHVLSPSLYIRRCMACYKERGARLEWPSSAENVVPWTATLIASQPPLHRCSHCSATVEQPKSQIRQKQCNSCQLWKNKPRTEGTALAITTLQLATTTTRMLEVVPCNLVPEHEHCFQTRERWRLSWYLENPGKRISCLQVWSRISAAAAIGDFSPSPENWEPCATYEKTCLMTSSCVINLSSEI